MYFFIYIYICIFILYYIFYCVLIIFFISYRVIILYSILSGLHTNQTKSGIFCVLILQSKILLSSHCSSGFLIHQLSDFRRNDADGCKRQNHCKNLQDDVCLYCDFIIGSTNSLSILYFGLGEQRLGIGYWF